MKKKYILFCIIAIVILLIGFKLYTNKKEINEEKAASETVEDIRIPILTDTVSYINVSNSLKKTGTLIPVKKAVIYAQAAGNLKQLNFELGDQVAKGELLATIDAKKLQIDLENARAKAKKLKHDLSIYKELLEGEATTQETVDQYQLDYTDAKNQVAQLEKQVYDTRLRSPLSGIVSDKKAELGVYVNSGEELATVIDISQLKVQVYVPENEIYQLTENSIVNFTTDVYPDKKFEGKMNYISSQADETHNYLVEAKLTNPKEMPLKSGTFVYANFTNETQRQILAIPRIALIENTGQAQVYVISEGKAFIKEISLGQNYGDMVEVTQGLKKGDVVVVSGQINLKDKSAVTISKNISK